MSSRALPNRLKAMIARLLTAQIQPARLNEASQLFRESLSLTLRGQRGFRGAWLLLDRNTCKSVALLMWETEADLRAGEGIASYQQQVAEIAGVCATTPTREVFEVGSWFPQSPTGQSLNSY